MKSLSERTDRNTSPTKQSEQLNRQVVVQRRGNVEAKPPSTKRTVSNMESASGLTRNSQDKMNGCNESITQNNW